jgi:type I restriction enzyme S subunit
MKAEQLPKNWTVVRLGDLIVEGPSNGYSGPTNDTAVGTKTLRLNATTQGFMILNRDTTKRLIEDIPEDSNYWLQPGDLLVQRSNTLEYLGASAIYEGEPNQYIYPDLMMRLRFSDPATTKWVWRFLNTSTARRYFQRVAGGTAGSMPKISGAKLKELQISLPPIEEQRRIAAILDRADAVRRKRQEAIALTEELLRSAFLEMFGDPVANPKEWEMVALEDCLIDIESGWSPECDSRTAEAEEWGVLKLGAVTYGHFDPDQNKALFPDTIPRPELEVKVGDLLITRKNTYELVGASAYVYSTRSKLLLPDLIFRLCLKASIDPVYLWQVLSQKSTRTQLSKLASGTSGSMPNISKARLRTLLVSLPPMENQMKYRNFVMHFWKQQYQQKGSSQVTDDLFNSLLQKAFRGEL